MIRTFETRIDLPSGPMSPAEVLDAHAALMARCERKLLAKLKSGHQWRGDLNISFYRDLGITADHLDMLYRQLEGRLSSIRELARQEIKDIAGKIKSKETDIKRKEKLLAGEQKRRKGLLAEIRKQVERADKWRAFLYSAAEGHPDHSRFLVALKACLDARDASTAALARNRIRVSSLEFDLHQHRRNHGSLRDRQKMARERAMNPSICFGTKKLFRAQHHLDANGYADHDEWLANWRTVRNRQFKLDGHARSKSGNYFARLSPRPDGSFGLELRMPSALSHLARMVYNSGGHAVYAVVFPDLRFAHGADVIRQAIAERQPVTVMFRHDGKSWKVHVTVQQMTKNVPFADSCGVIAVDVNAGFLSVMRTDRFGNPVESFDVPFVTHGKTEAQSQNSARKLAAVIAAYANRHGGPIVIEDLDFAAKKKDLKAKHPRYARMLSSFAYSAVGAALERVCARSGIALRRVNPAYTSLIGRVKFARRYGLSVHQAAALCIARRAMKFSESVPTNPDGTVSVPRDDGSVVTLCVPARKRIRHVWSVWSAINSEKQKVFATHRSPGHKPRPPHGFGRVRGATDSARRVVWPCSAGRSQRKRLQSQGHGSPSAWRLNPPELRYPPWSKTVSIIRDE